MNTPNHYDLIINGGGIVGLALAALLADNTPLRIAVVEKNQLTTAPPTITATFALRVSALTRATQRLLERLGIWRPLCALRVSPYRAMQVWDPASGGSLHFDSATVAAPDLGHIVENTLLQGLLVHKVQTGAAIKLITDQALAAVELTDQHAIVTLANGQTLITSLLVGADGAHSSVRQLTGIATHGWDYGQQALVTTVRTSQPHHQIARQVFLPSGPLAFLPLADPFTCSIVWSVAHAEATQLLGLPEADFNQALAKQFAYRLGDTSVLSQRLAFPLRMQHAKQYVKPRVALIGDAAHTLHPLAGQGINLGLLDAQALAETLIASHLRQRDLGQLFTLRKYERARKGPNWGMIALMELFHQGFTRHHSALTALRHYVLQGVDRLDWLKGLFIKQALG